jgi:hypothetical protein
MSAQHYYDWSVTFDWNNYFLLLGGASVAADAILRKELENGETNAENVTILPLRSGIRLFY